MKWRLMAKQSACFYRTLSFALTSEFCVNTSWLCTDSGVSLPARGARPSRSVVLAAAAFLPSFCFDLYAKCQ